MVPETHFWGGATIKGLKIGFRVLLKIAVSTTGGVALVVLFIALYDPEINQDVADVAFVCGSIFGAYVGILWSVGNWVVRHWLIWAPLVGFAAGVFYGSMRHPRTDNYALPNSQQPLKLIDTLTEVEKQKLNEFWDMGALNNENIDKFAEVLARHDPNDPERIQKTLKTLGGARREAIISMGVVLGLIGLFVGVVGALNTVGAFGRKGR